MRPEVLEPLAQTLEAIGAAVPEGFTLVALWVGDAPSREQLVSLEQLTTIARAGRLGTKTHYRVSLPRRSGMERDASLSPRRPGLG
jgi:hypothetical protein